MNTQYNIEYGWQRYQVGIVNEEEIKKPSRENSTESSWKAAYHIYNN